MYKLIIVDDEITEIKFVRYVVDTFKLPFHICGEGENGEEAVALMRKHGADFVVMDINMPLLDGLAAANIIKKEFPQTKIYLLTAYASFEYAQQAVKVDVEDYLLKPVKPEHLVAALKKGIAGELRQRLANHEIDRMKQNAETAKPLLKRQFMLELLTGGKPHSSTMASLQQMLGLQIQPSGVLVAAASQAESGAALSGSFLRGTLVEEIEKSGDFGFCELLPSGRLVILTKAWNPKIQRAFKDRMETWGHTRNIQLFAGFVPLNAQEDIPLAFAQAEKISQTALFWRKPGIYLTVQLGSLQTCLPEVPAIQKAAFNLLLERNIDKAREVLRNALGSLHTRFVLPEQTISVANQIVNALLLELAEHVPGEEPALAQKYLQDINSVTCHLELENTLFELLEDILRLLFDSSETMTGQSIQWAASYLRENYRENITLEQMAGKLFLSPSYFSRLFKKQLGEGFAIFLTKIRMEHARNLLVTGKYSVAQIAKQVGYYDPSYFSTVYKKHYGISPQQVMPVANHKE